MTSEVIYNGDLRTTAVHLQSGNKIITDAPTDNQGKGEAFSPTDLVATALASCALTIMGIVARRHNWNIETARATVQKTMTDNPRRISRIEITLEIPAANLTDQDKELLEKAAHSCPVSKSLRTDLEQVLHFVWKD